MQDMKNRTMISTLAALACAGLMPALAADIKTKVKCTEVITRLESEISKEPARVLLSVEDALNSNDSCACDIIKTAITASHADAKLVGEIVSTAINTVPTAASTIGECALTAAPEAAKEIKAAMQTVLGQGDGVGKAPISKESAGKEPIGKEPISAGKTPIMLPPAQVTGDTDVAVRPVDIQGIYFAVPGSGGTPPTTVEKTVTKIVKIIKKECCHCPPVYVPATKS
jgi:hypothetical protein